MSARRAVHAGLRPVALTFETPAKLERPIRLRQGVVDRLLCASSDHLTDDHAVFKSVYLGEDVLIRRSPASSHNRETQVHLLLEELSAHGAPVLPLLEMPIRIGKYCYSVQPYLEHRLYAGTPEDLDALGLSLRNLSRAFSCLRYKPVPARHIVDTWLEGVDEKADKEPNYEASCEIVKTLRHLGGMAHNDIHPGNILFTANKKAIIIDFEESIQNISHAFFDIHSAVERFILTYNMNDIDIIYNSRLFGCPIKFCDIDLFKAVGCVKNTFYMYIAESNKLYNEVDKFKIIRKLWSDI